MNECECVVENENRTKSMLNSLQHTVDHSVPNETREKEIERGDKQKILQTCKAHGNMDLHQFNSLITAWINVNERDKNYIERQ